MDIHSILPYILSVLVGICIAGSVVYIQSNRNKKNLFVTMKEVYNSSCAHKTKIWYEVEDHLPESYRLVVAYSDVFSTYELAYIDPRIGWCKEIGKSYSNITHWCDDDLFLPFEAIYQMNEDLARKNGIIE